jgi:hypothetical protein
VRRQELQDIADLQLVSGNAGIFNKWARRAGVGEPNDVVPSGLPNKIVKPVVFIKQRSTNECNNREVGWRVDARFFRSELLARGLGRLAGEQHHMSFSKLRTDISKWRSKSVEWRHANINSRVTDRMLEMRQSRSMEVLSVSPDNCTGGGSASGMLRQAGVRPSACGGVTSFLSKQTLSDGAVVEGFEELALEPEIPWDEEEADQAFEFFAGMGLDEGE